MSRRGLQADERSALIFRRLCTRMYLATMGVLWLDVLYRQLWLRQPAAQFLDIALMLIVNVVLSIGAVLYSGGVSIPKVRIWVALVFYAVSVAAGSSFWILKDPTAAPGAMLARFLIVASMAGILVLSYLLAARLGARRLDRDLED